jgi:pimeloyl-ACP methyl ester carboxylesterase
VNGQRIIYVTGMKPKPDPVVHRPELVRMLSASLARTEPAAAAWLTARAENFVLVSWTSMLYSERQNIEADLPGIRQLLAHPTPSARDRREADAFRRNLLRRWHLIGDSYPWLSRLVASQQLNVTLGDVRRYLENHDGVAVRVRQMLLDELLAAWEAGERVLLMGHSLGSAIAYDSLWHLSRECKHPGRVELFMTLGSPLATRFIRKRLQGAERSGPERFPSNIDRWVNVAARGEMVALHRRVKPFFGGMQKAGLVQSIEDLDIYNHFRKEGQLNVHKSYGYLNHPAVAERVRKWLAV